MHCGLEIKVQGLFTPAFRVAAVVLLLLSVCGILN